MKNRELRKFIKKLLRPFFIKEKIAMLHPGRCGSTVLGKLINQHPELYWSGEAFLHFHSDKPLSKTRIKKILSDAEVIKMRKHYIFATKYPRGMDLSIHCVDMSIKEYVEFLVSLGYKKFVFLNRENYLRRAISMEKGRQTGVWHLKDGDQVKQNHLLSIDINSFCVGGGENIPLIEYFERLDAEAEEIKSVLSKYPTLYLSYEADIENDPTVAFNKYCDFLGVQQVEAQVKLKKTGSEGLRKTIANYDELYDYFKETKYSWMFD